MQNYSNDPQDQGNDKDSSAGLPVALTSDDRTWGMLAHLSAVCGHVFPLVGNILGPLVIWLIKRDKSAFVDDQGKEALNAQISVTIYLLVSGLLTLVLIGIALAIVVYVLTIIFVIKAIIATNRGEAYRYPLIFRFVK